MLNISFNQDKSNEHKVSGLIIDEKSAESLAFTPDVATLDKKVNGAISHFLKSKQFTGKPGEVKVISSSEDENSMLQIILVGCSSGDIQEHEIEEIGGILYKAANSISAASITVNSVSLANYTVDMVSASLALGAKLAAYKFDKYKTAKKTKTECENFNITCDNVEKTEVIYSQKQALFEGIELARNLVSEVPNVLYPETYAEIIVKELEGLANVKILGEREMIDLGMGALIGVGLGSARESKMAIIEYNGTGNSEKPVCFVGKGVTFDTGGISLKPPANMHEMKSDMGGSAAVVGVMKALARRQAKINAIGIVGLVENMPGGRAQRPGDVVKTMSGQTVEVLNTDAEGRLVLADCLTYLQKNYEPACVIDLATLTGAIVISLGYSFAGCFSNDDNLASSLIDAGLKTGERLWRMPLDKDFEEMIKSPVADIANIGGMRGLAGSSTAAEFLAKFIEKDVKWSHLDIAGMAWEKVGNKACKPKGATGYGVRLLNQFVQDNYEQPTK